VLMVSLISIKTIVHLLVHVKICHQLKIHHLEIKTNHHLHHLHLHLLHLLLHHHFQKMIQFLCHQISLEMGDNIEQDIHSLVVKDPLPWTIKDIREVQTIDRNLLVKQNLILQNVPSCKTKTKR